MKKKRELALTPLRRTCWPASLALDDDDKSSPASTAPASLNVPESLQERRFAFAVAAEVDALPKTVTKALRSPLGEMAVRSHRLRELLRPFVREWRARQAELAKVAGED